MGLYIKQAIYSILSFLEYLFNQKSFEMAATNLIDALAKLLKCEKVALHDYMNHPIVENKVSDFLKDKKLRTTYVSRCGEKKMVKFGYISRKSPCEQHAYEGFLGNIYVKLLIDI